MVKLEVEEKGKISTEIRFDKTIVRVGRGEDNDLILTSDRAVSTYHLEIEHQGDVTVVRDLGSTNGTFVNNSQLARNETKTLSHGDEVALGKSKLIFLNPDIQRRVERERTTVVSDTVDKGIKSLNTGVFAVAKQVEEMTSLVQTDGISSRLSELAAPLQQVQEDLTTVSKAYQQLSALYEATKTVISDFDLKKRLELIMDTAIQVMQAERGFLILTREDTGDLNVEVARGMGQELRGGSPSMTIASDVVRTGVPHIFSELGPGPVPGESVIIEGIRSAMCVPLQVQDRNIGCIYVDNKSSPDCFQREDVDLFAALASQSAIAIENARLFENIKLEERRRSNLERFLGPNIAEQIVSQTQEIELGGEEQVVTALFTDIRGYTALTSKMKPTDTVDMLNRYFTEMSKIIFEYKGTLNKYVADGILAIFGAPISYGDDATRAVQAAMMMLARLNELKKVWGEQGLPVFDIGIGINTGLALVGNIGSPIHMEYTIIGDTVNVASRFSDIAEPGQILISHQTFEQVKSTMGVRRLVVHPKGKDEPIEVFEVLTSTSR